MDWQQAAKELENLLRLRTFPIAVKRIFNKEELSEISNFQMLKHRHSFCQVVNMVRTSGYTINITRDKLMPICSVLFGLRELPEGDQGDYGTRIWVECIDDAQKKQRATPTIPLGHESIILAPLEKNKFDPEVVLLFGTPAQMCILLCGLQFVNYERFQFYFSGEGACVDSLAECYLRNKVAITIPCYGERYMGQVQEEELSIGIPQSQIGNAITGLKKLYERGIRYPIPSIGTDVDPFPIESQYYHGTWLAME